MERWARIGAIATIAAVVVGVATYVTQRDGADDGQRGKTTGSGNVCQSSSSGDVSCPYIEAAKDVSELAEEEILKYSQAHDGEPPTPTGPWPFSVVNTATLGLKVRSTNQIEAVQLGGIANSNAAWAVCREDSDFDPVPGDENGSTWLKIKWDHQVPDEKGYYQSQPSAKATAWAYGGFLVPIGHSGKIPTC